MRENKKLSRGDIKTLGGVAEEQGVEAEQRLVEIDGPTERILKPLQVTQFRVGKNLLEFRFLDWFDTRARERSAQLLGRQVVCAGDDRGGGLPIDAEEADLDLV